MKNSILFGCFLLLCLFSGCFEDEGNYDYKELNGPNWLIDVNSSFIRMTGYEGRIIKFTGRNYFKWDTDSALHEANVRYEWKLRDKVFGREADFEIETDSLIKFLELENPFNEDGHSGTFNIIDQTTGISFMSRFYLKIKARFSEGNWLVLSESGNTSKLSYVERKSRYGPSGAIEVFYELTDDVFKTINGEDIPGKPITLAKAMAKNVGSLGSTTIMTDKVAYVINNETMVKVSELKDEFLSGTPENLNVVDRHDCENYTFITTRDGRIFRRIMSENYLGGKFISEPYSIDDRGYNVLTFGHTKSNLVDVPCYDEQNRRVLKITFKTEIIYDPDRQYITTNAIVPVTKGVGNKDNIPPVWEMPEGTEVLYLTRYNTLDFNREWYTIFYNASDGKTYTGDFALSVENVCLEVEGENVKLFPGGSLDKSSLFLTSADNRGPQKTVMYTKGNEIRYVDRNENKDYLFLQCASKVTYIGYPILYSVDAYKKLVIGLEDGTLLFYELNPSNMQMPPKLLSSLNVGGKIVSAKELGHIYNGDAY